MTVREDSEYALKRGLNIDLEKIIDSERGTQTSDRATTILPNGAVVFVAAKKNPYYPFGFSMAHTRETKGVAYTLSVTVLTAGSLPGSRVGGLW
jgi:hypothetical protein